MLDTELEKVIYSKIVDFIENEIHYIEKYDYEKSKNDIKFLESLSAYDIAEITRSICNSEQFDEYLREEIHYRVYHYRVYDYQDKKGGNE